MSERKKTKHIDKSLSGMVLLLITAGLTLVILWIIWLRATKSILNYDFEENDIPSAMPTNSPTFGNFAFLESIVDVMLWHDYDYQLALMPFEFVGYDTYKSIPFKVSYGGHDFNYPAIYLSYENLEDAEAKYDRLLDILLNYLSDDGWQVAINYEIPEDFNSYFLNSELLTNGEHLIAMTIDEEYITGEPNNGEHSSNYVQSPRLIVYDLGTLEEFQGLTAQKQIMISKYEQDAAFFDEFHAAFPTWIVVECSDYIYWSDDGSWYNSVSASGLCMMGDRTDYTDEQQQQIMSTVNKLLARMNYEEVFYDELRGSGFPATLMRRYSDTQELVTIVSLGADDDGDGFCIWNDPPNCFWNFNIRKAVTIEQMQAEKKNTQLAGAVYKAIDPSRKPSGGSLSRRIDGPVLADQQSRYLMIYNQYNGDSHYAYASVDRQGQITVLMVGDIYFWDGSIICDGINSNTQLTAQDRKFLRNYCQKTDTLISGGDI